MIKAYRTFCGPLCVLAALGLIAGCALQGESGTRATQPPVALLSQEASASLVARAQILLTEIGYKPGPADGIAGPRTEAAVRAYQAQAGLGEDGRVTGSLVDRLAVEAETGRVASAQRRLGELGYDAGPVDGRAGPRTRSAIEAFQRTSGLPADGEVSPDLLAALDAAATASAPAAPAEDVVSVPEPAEGVEKTTEVAALQPETRLLIPGDLIRLRYLGVGDKPVDLRIGGDGAISLPDSRPITAAGLQLAELRDRITVSLIEDYMKTLEIDVVLLWATGDVQARTGDDGVARLGPGDVVRVKISGDDISPANVEVASDGSLAVPGNGNVMAGGLTVEEVEAEISIHLLESYMDKLDVAVDLVENG